MKQILFFLLLCSGFVFPQALKKTKIVDSETGKVLADVRVISAEQIYYSNAEGFISLPKDVTQLDVFALGYQKLSLPKAQSVIKLKPLYNDIDEVKIVSVDVKKIFADVLKNYSKRYYDKPAMYEVTYSQKSFENGQMRLLAIADGKFWTRDGRYNAKKAFNGKQQDFVQLQIDKLKYFKINKNAFNIPLKQQKVSHEYVGMLFFDYELFYMLRWSKTKSAVTSGKLLHENGDEQEILYKVKLDNDRTYSGRIIYNKKDRAIIFYERTFDQSKVESITIKDKNGVDYEYLLPSGTVVFDFYKNGEKYVPARISSRYEGSKYMQGENSFEYHSSREVVFRNFTETTESGVQNPVAVQDYFWKDIKVEKDQEQADLTQEERNFINEGKYEN